MMSKTEQPTVTIKAKLGNGLKMIPTRSEILPPPQKKINNGSFLVAQWVKDLALSLPWNRFNPVAPGTSTEYG